MPHPRVRAREGGQLGANGLSQCLHEEFTKLAETRLAQNNFDYLELLLNSFKYIEK